MANGPFFPKSGRSIRRQIESMQKRRLAQQKVVDLSSYRDLQVQKRAVHVLVVDDDEIMRNALKRILEIDGYQVRTAQDGMELSQTLESSRLDLILLDVNLPWVDGIELCQILKTSPAYRDVPLVMISAKTGEEDIKRAFKAGCDDYITKPFDVTHLSQVVRTAVEKVSGENF